MFRSFALAAAGLSLTMFVSASQAAMKTTDTTHNGTVVSAGAGKLVMTGKDKKEHSHEVAATAKIMVDGKAAKLEELKKGAAITVTTDKAGKVTAISTPVAKTPAKPAVTKTTVNKPVAKTAVKASAKASAPVATPAAK